MNKEQLTNHFLKINQSLFESAANPMKSHGPDHHLRVLNNALALLERLKAGADFEILIPACLLHDLAAYFPERGGDEYHKLDVELAERKLKKINYPAEKTEKILETIAKHGSDPKDRNVKESIETTILRDADKMDIFGPLGVARIIMARTVRGNTLEEIAEIYHKNGYLERKWNSITTEIAKDLSRKDYEYSLSFFKDLSAKTK